MSKIGERIGRRLAKRHGFQFQDDPCNFFVHSDPEAVAINTHGGLGVMQWNLSCDCGWHRELVTITFRGENQQAEIGSEFGASTCLSWKFWKVYLYTMSGQQPIIWIDCHKEQDRTELDREF